MLQLMVSRHCRDLVSVISFLVCGSSKLLMAEGDDDSPLLGFFFFSLSFQGPVCKI